MAAYTELTNGDERHLVKGQLFYSDRSASSHWEPNVQTLHRKLFLEGKKIAAPVF